MNNDNCYTVLKKLYQKSGRPLRIACDWDEVMYVTEKECLRRLIERNPGLVPPAVVQDLKRSDTLEDISLYPHGAYWQVSTALRLQEIAKKIFFEPDIFKQENVMDTYDALIQGLEEGIIESLIFLTYSPLTSKGLDFRKKEIFNTYFGEASKNKNISMVIIPFRIKGVPYEKGHLLGTIIDNLDLLIDNHLDFIRWSIAFSKVRTFMVPYFNQKISVSLQKLIDIFGVDIHFYKAQLSKILKRF